MARINFQCGIYKITCTGSGKIYVGSSQNIINRFNAHRFDLRRNKHSNSYLQRSWNKYGEESFIFEIIENVPVDKLVERETFWMRELRSNIRQNGFNQQRACMTYHTAETRRKLSFAFKGRTHTEETKQKMSEARRGKPRSEETKRKLSLAHMGKKMSPEAIAKTSQALKGRTISEYNKQRSRETFQKRYVVTDPNGVSQRIVNLSAFCKEHGLTASSMSMVAVGRYSNHKGWLCRYDTED